MSQAFAKPDPIFELIDAQRAARQRYDNATRTTESLLESLPNEISRSPRVQIARLRREDGEIVPRYAYGHDEIKSEVHSTIGGWNTTDRRKALKDWGKRKNAEFQADVVQQTRLQSEAGLTAARLTEKEADEAEAWALDAVLDATPTTAAGALALAQFMREYDLKYLHDFDESNPGYRTAAALERCLAVMHVA